MENQKNNNIMIILLGIFIFLTLMLGGFIIYDKLYSNSNDGNDVNNSETSGNEENNQKPGNSEIGGNEENNQKPGNSEMGGYEENNQKPGNSEIGGNEENNQKPGNSEMGGNEEDNSLSSIIDKITEGARLATVEAMINGYISHVENARYVYLSEHDLEEPKSIDDLNITRTNVVCTNMKFNKGIIQADKCSTKTDNIEYTCALNEIGLATRCARGNTPAPE